MVEVYEREECVFRYVQMVYMLYMYMLRVCRE